MVPEAKLRSFEAYLHQHIKLRRLVMLSATRAIKGDAQEGPFFRPDPDFANFSSDYEVTFVRHDSPFTETIVRSQRHFGTGLEIIAFPRPGSLNNSQRRLLCL